MPQNNQLIPLEANIQDEENEDPLGISDGQLVQLIQQCEQENEQIMMSQEQQITDGKSSKKVTKHVMSKKTSSSQIPIFHQCKIENIAININK